MFVVGQIFYFEDCDAVRKSIVVKRNIFNVTRKLFANGAFVPTKCYRSNVVLVQGEGSSY